MLDSIDSDYNCANASSDLPQLMEQLEALQQEDAGDNSQMQQEQINQLHNQIRFIQNKCDIPKGSQ